MFAEASPYSREVSQRCPRADLMTEPLRRLLVSMMVIREGRITNGEDSPRSLASSHSRDLTNAGPRTYLAS